MNAATESSDMPSCSDGLLCGVIGVGVDLVDVESFARLLRSGGDAFISTAWTELEQQDAERSIERLAARWAAKEAVMKALGRALGDVDPLDVEIARVSTGALEVRLHHSASIAAERVGAGCLHVSISHEQGWAIAFAVSTRRHREPHPVGRKLGNS